MNKKPVDNIRSVQCLGYTVFADTLSSIRNSEEKLLINTINQYSFCIAEKDPDFKKSLKESSVLLPDGVGITLASRLLHNNTIQKIAGADIHQFYLEELNKKNGSCFYMGSSENTLQKIKARIALEYPNITVGTYSPPYKPVFSEEENAVIIQRVNDFQPDVLFVGMTAPKQEKWSYRHFKELDAKVVCSIGAVFDFYAGTVERPGRTWQKLGLEWMGRLIKEPKRMYKRYINYGFVFMGYLIKEKFTGNKVIT